MTCRTCKYLDVPLNKAGLRVTSVKLSYACTVPVPPLPDLPESVRLPIRYGDKWKMGPNEGAGCVGYEKYRADQS